METDFNTVCEDESTDEIGELLVNLWRQCGEGDFTIVNKIISTESKRLEVIGQSRGLERGDEMDSDDENEGLSMPRLDAIVEGTSGIDETDMETEELESAEPEPPRIDPDGWETVTRNNKKGKGGKRN